MAAASVAKKKNHLLRISTGVLIAFLIIQFIPYGRDHTNPPVLAEPPWDQPQTRQTFFTACGDCHSNETKWPWYSHVAPVSWLVAHDVEDGRSELNVSEWGRPKNRGYDAVEEIQDGEMPLWQYTLLHPEASLSEEEKQTFIQGLRATFGEAEGGG